MREIVRSVRYPFAVDPGLAELAAETDHAAHVRQMMLQVLFTAQGERLNRPDFGCGIRRMVFAPSSDASASLAQVTILEALETWMGTLITVDTVDVKFGDGLLEVTIVYVLRTTGERRYLNVEVES